MAEPVKVEFTVNPLNGDIGIGVVLGGNHDGNVDPNLSSFARFLRWIKGEKSSPSDQQALDQKILDGIIARAHEYPLPNVEAFRVGHYWRTLEQQPHMTAVMSGKGGVGKTSIALGLTELYSISENVLLIDFDLHNRGLTSKYGEIRDNTTTVLAEMSRFRQAILSDERLPREDGKLALSRLEDQLFHDLREKYCYSTYPVTKNLSPLNMEYLYSSAVRNSADASRARPANCYFLPSRRGGESFLGSKESSFDAAEVAVFLTYLGSLAHRHGITRVVVDCHGAHDLLMVGAILASEHLVVVTRPEQAAFEGTIELIRFSQSIVESQKAFPSSKILILNDYRDSDKNIAETLLKAIYKEDADKRFEDVPKIRSSDQLRDLFKYYCKPSLLDNPNIGREIEKLGGIRSPERKRGEGAPSPGWRGSGGREGQRVNPPVAPLSEDLNTP